MIVKIVTIWVLRWRLLVAVFILFRYCLDLDVKGWKMGVQKLFFILDFRLFDGIPVSKRKRLKFYFWQIFSDWFWIFKFVLDHLLFQLTGSHKRTDLSQTFFKTQCFAVDHSSNALPSLQYVNGSTYGLRNLRTSLFNKFKHFRFKHVVLRWK